MPNGELLGGCGALHGELGTVVLDLGGKPQEKTVKPSVVPVVVEPDDGKKLTKVTVNAVTADIDENIVAQNIRGGVEILGVVGELEPDKPNQSKFAEPSVEEQVVRADSGYELEQVTIRGVTSEIDANIVPSNIRKGKVILGVQGNLEPDKPDQSKRVVPSTSKQVVMADNGYELVSVEVDAVTSAIDSDIKAENIRKDVEILGVVGTMEQREDLDAELNEQEELLAELESSVEELQEKPVNPLQLKCDNMKSLAYEFYIPLGADTTNFNEEAVIAILKGIDTSKVKIMNSMFQTYASTSAYAIYKDLSSITLDLSGCTSCTQMFYNQTQLTTLPTLLNTGNVTDMSNMFYNCYALTIIPQLDTSKVTNMSSAFNKCRELTELHLQNTRNCTNFSNFVDYCYELKTLETLDVLNATHTLSFAYCTNLTNLTLQNIKKSAKIGSGTTYGHLLTDNSIVNTFQELWDLTGSSTQTLTLSTPSLARTSEIYVKLIDVTDAMRAEDEYIDNKKPCVVCESTDAGAMTLREYGISKGWNIA